MAVFISECLSLVILKSSPRLSNILAVMKHFKISEMKHILKKF